MAGTEREMEQRNEKTYPVSYLLLSLSLLPLRFILITIDYHMKIEVGTRIENKKKEKSTALCRSYL